MNYNIVLGEFAKTPNRPQIIWTTPPHGFHFISPQSLQVDVEMALEDSPSQHIVVDNEVVGASRGVLVKCKTDSKLELEVVLQKHTNEVHDLKGQIEELRNLGSEQQGLSTMVGIDGPGRKLGGMMRHQQQAWRQCGLITTL